MKPAAAKSPASPKATPAKAPTARAAAKAPTTAAKPAAKTGAPAAKPVAKAAPPAPAPARSAVAKKASASPSRAPAMPPMSAPKLLPMPTVAAPPVPIPVKKDPKLANSWKTKPVDQLSDAEVIAMPDSEYMNDTQLAFFRLKLVQLKDDILANAGQTAENLRQIRLLEHRQLRRSHFLQGRVVASHSDHSASFVRGAHARRTFNGEPVAGSPRSAGLY